MMNGRFALCRRLVVVLLTLYWAALFVGTHIPRMGVPGGNDKLAHFLAFSGLAFLLAWCLAALRPTRVAILSVLAIVILYAAMDESTQLLVPTRNGDIADWLADVAGGVAGLVAYAVALMLVRAVWATPPSTASVAPSREAAQRPRAA
jgi:VanZ family protein